MSEDSRKAGKQQLPEKIGRQLTAHMAQVLYASFTTETLREMIAIGEELERVARDENRTLPNEVLYMNDSLRAMVATRQETVPA